MRVAVGQSMDGMPMAVVRDGDGWWVVVRVLGKGFKMGFSKGW